MNRTNFEKLLRDCVKLKASDLHLTVGDIPCYRIHGRLEKRGVTPFSAEDIMGMANDIMTEQQKQGYGKYFTADIGYSMAEGGRFRVNIYRELGRPAMAVRYLDQNLKSFEQMGLPLQLKELAYLKSGLVLVTGATGSGKSTTLSLIIDEINTKRDCHILTVEDPVEFIHQNKKSLIHHREVHSDVPDFAHAVRDALREDPDVIMVGEMRDIETIQACLVAAETGHLVFSTLHSGEAVGAVERLIGSFSGDEQDVARHRISMVLKAVIAQRLLTTWDQKARIAALEMLRITRGAANLIKSSKARQLYSMMEAGSKDGMWTMDQYLARLVKLRKIDRNDALAQCENPGLFDRLVASVSARENF